MKRFFLSLAALAISCLAFAADLIPQENINGKFGYSNPQGFMIIRAKFDSARPFREKRAAVEIDGKWGFINEQGRFVGKCEYQDVRDFVGGYALVKKDNLWGVMDMNGKLVKPCEAENEVDLLKN